MHTVHFHLALLEFFIRFKAFTLQGHKYTKTLRGFKGEFVITLQKEVVTRINDRIKNET